MTRSVALLSISGLVAALLLLGACSTRIAIRSMQPARVPVGQLAHLTILDGSGRRSARETVYLELMRQARSAGYFSVSDRSEDGIEVRIAGRRARVEGAELSATEAGMRVDVVEWNVFRDLDEVTHTDADGNPQRETVRTQNASVVLAISLFGRSLRLLLAEREYLGAASSHDPEITREELLDQAASQAVAALLADITPRRVTTHVRLDDDDPGQEYILQTARAGNVAQAARDAEHYLEQHPLSAAAAYNLAVFLDAMGRYSDALEMYDHAMRLGNQGWYASARAGCARRRASQEALADSGR